MPSSLTLKLATLVLLAAPLAAHAQSAMRQTPIIDPVLQMPAWILTLPKSWSVDGTMLPNSSCVPATSPTYHASSADDQYGVYFLPRIDWSWGAAGSSGNDCLPLQQTLSAKQFLMKMMASRQVNILREEPVSDLAEIQHIFEASDRQSGGARHTTADKTSVLVSYRVNHQPVEELDTATVTCVDALFAAIGREPSHQYSCSAFVSRWYAPQGKLQAALPTFRSIKLALNQPWMDQWQQRTAARMQAFSQQQTEVLLQQGRLAQAALTRQQASFMADFNRQGEVRKNGFAQQQYEKQRHSDDFVDYVLDCSRLYSGSNRVSVGGNCPNRQTF